MKWFGGFELIYMPQAHNVCFAFSIVFAVLTMQLLLGFTQPDQLVSECRLHPQYQKQYAMSFFSIYLLLKINIVFQATD